MHHLDPVKQIAAAQLVESKHCSELSQDALDDACYQVALAVAPESPVPPQAEREWSKDVERTGSSSVSGCSTAATRAMIAERPSKGAKRCNLQCKPWPPTKAGRTNLFGWPRAACGRWCKNWVDCIDKPRRREVERLQPDIEAFRHL
jgi:hypothetical protein